MIQLLLTMINRFCFVAIVKNESHIIRRCLDSIVNIATSYLICDTGSDDDTPKIIESYMKEKNIPGQVIYNKWIDYGYNKSLLLKEAFINNKADNAKYLIWHDADEVFLTDVNDKQSFPTINDTNELYNYLESRTEPITYIKTYNGNLQYNRWNIVKNNQLYVWHSPKHEWLEGTIDNSLTFYDKIVLYAYPEGSSRTDPNKSVNDVNMFLKYIDNNGGDVKCPREVFYLAQEYESIDKLKAIEYYTKRTEITNGYCQEIYISYLRLGRLVDDNNEKIKYWTLGYNLLKSRLECIYELMLIYYNMNILIKSLEWSLKNQSREINHDDLFIEYDIYQYLFDLQLSLTAYYIGNYELANYINIKNLNKNRYQTCYELLLSNQKFFDEKIDKNKIFSVNKNIHKPNIVVVDNFYECPDIVRYHALNKEYNVYGNYPGIRTEAMNENEQNEIKNIFESIVGKKIVYWPYKYNGSFQYTTEKDISWIHRDNTDYSAIIYLTPNPPLNSGVVLYQHKGTNLEFTNCDKEEDILNLDSYNENNWKKIDIIGNKYNRCVIFNGKLSHKSNMYFGNDRYDGRLFQTFFFDVDKI